jgi:hypothetical protein
MSDFDDFFAPKPARSLDEVLGDIKAGKVPDWMQHRRLPPGGYRLILNPYDPSDRRIAGECARQKIGIDWAVPLTDGAHEEV